MWVGIMWEKSYRTDLSGLIGADGAAEARQSLFLKIKQYSRGKIRVIYGFGECFPYRGMGQMPR